MIKQEITLTIGESEYSGDLKVPSVVLTSTPQEEELDLTKSPNFQITINDQGDITDTVEVEFTAEEVIYTANMKVVNRNGNFVTLQYVDGLTTEDVPKQSVAPTITYNNETFTVSATGEGTVKMYVNGEEVENPYTFEQGAEDATYTVTATAQQDGKTVSDIVSIDCFVPAASQPEQHTYTVVGTAQLCGTDWNPTDANNDMVDKGDNIYSWLREGLQINNTSDARFQIVQDHSFDTMYPGKDYYLQLSETGVYNIAIVFNPDTKEITATPTYVEPLPEPEPEPDYSVLIYNRNGSSEVSLPWKYDLSSQNPTDSLDLTNATRVIPAISLNTLYSVKVFDNNTGEEVELTEDNFSMASNGKSLVYWNSTYNNYTLDLQDSQSQSLNVDDFLGDVIITVNDVQQTKSLPIIPPSIGTSFDYIYSSTVGGQMIINLEGGNNKMYLVDAYAPGGTGGTYYKDIIVNDGQGHSMLIYNTDSNIADTTNFSTRPDTDFTGQTLTCKEMKINGSRIKWIAGTAKMYRSDMQVESTNLSAFTLDDNSTATADILYPETTSIGSIEAQNRYPIKIEAGTISALSANGSVEFTDPESGETVTINIFRVDTSTSTATYNGMVCTLTGIYDAMSNVIDWTSLTSNA